MAPGTYRVSASASEHQSRYFSDPATPTRPTRIVVAAGADQTGKDIALDRLGRISGTVSGPSGTLAGATVRVYRWSNPSFVQVDVGADDGRRGVLPDRSEPGQLPPGVLRYRR